MSVVPYLNVTCADLLSHTKKTFNHFLTYYPLGTDAAMTARSNMTAP